MIRAVVDRGPTDDERRALCARFEREVAKAHNIAPQLPKILEYARVAWTSAEIGVQRGRSATALLLGTHRFVIGVDPVETPECCELQRVAGDRFLFWQARSSEVELPEVDLLFVDGEHTYAAVLEDLTRHAPKVRQRIMLHDTTACRFRGARQVGTEEPEWLEDDPGVWPAIEEFLQANPTTWTLELELPEGCGMTILGRLQ